VIRGGLRTRLVLDSVRFAVITALQQEGWFDPTVYDTPPGERRHRPFRYITRPVDWAQNIQPNAIAISPEDLADEPLAFGGEVEDAMELYIDVFAQDDSLGWQASYDIRDSLLGKTKNAVGPQIDIYDFRQPSPAPFTTVDVDLIEVDQSQGEARIWQRYWFMLHLIVLDDYADEFPSAPTTPASQAWTDTDLQIWQQIQEAEAAS
jgi:hypothetical protein